MRFFFYFILICLCNSCQNSPVYDEEAFNEMKRPNRLIEPFGSYLFSGTLDTFKTPKIILDSNSVILEYRDSLNNYKTIEGKWEKRTLDTQFFSLPKPFNHAMLSYNFLFILDSQVMHVLNKVDF